MEFKSARFSKPFQYNSQVCVQIEGHLTKDMDKGSTATLTALVGSFRVYDKTVDACAYIKCPLKAGDQSLNLCFDTPKDGPKGVRYVNLHSICTMKNTRRWRTQCLVTIYIIDEGGLLLQGYQPGRRANRLLEWGYHHSISVGDGINPSINIVCTASTETVVSTSWL